MNATKIGADVAKVASSNYDVVRNGAVKAANWLGRQVEWIGGSVKTSILKVVSWAKPFFAALMKIVGESLDKTKEFLVANKEIALPAAVIALVAVIAALSIDKLVCNSEAQAKAI